MVMGQCVLRTQCPISGGMVMRLKPHNHKQLYNRIISPIISKICDVKKVMLKNDVKKISKNYVVLSKSVSVCKKSKIVFKTLTLGNIVSWFVLSFLFSQMFFVF